MRGDRRFTAALAVLGGGYVVLLLLLLAADLWYALPGVLLKSLSSPELRASVVLTLWTTALSALLSLLVGIPLGYLLSRERFPGRGVVDAIVDVPVVLPPLVVGLSLLILFQWAPLRKLDREWIQVVYSAPGVVLAQFTVSAAFATRAMKVAFDQRTARSEQVAMTLGCTRMQAFLRVTLPEARRGVLAAGTIAWARALGEFGPVMVFAGTTRGKTEVLSTSVFLELSVGNLDAAVAVSLLMVAIAVGVLLVLRAGTKS
jgi:molybdate transport system permease protein